jgi:hypothetical protein
MLLIALFFHRRVPLPHSAGCVVMLRLGEAWGTFHMQWGP